MLNLDAIPIGLIPLLCLSLVRPAEAWLGLEWPHFGKQQRFTYEGLVNAGALGLETSGMVAAVGDVEGDQLLDLFVLSQDQRSLQVWLWDKESYTFKASTASPVQAPGNLKITNVVPGDCDYDGRLDLLIMSQEKPNGGWWSDDQTLRMHFYRGLGKANFGEPMELPTASPVQPMVLDANGNMKPDLLGMPSGENARIRLWKNVMTPEQNTTLFEMSDPPLDMNAIDCKMAGPHSNAFLDLDGDCLADLFLTCTDPSDSDRLTYQIWLNKKEMGFVFSQSGQLPKGTGQVSFADIDRDGTLDMVFPSCNSGNSDCYINIAYNEQVPLCIPGPLNLKECRDANDLCVSDPNFKFDLNAESSAFARFPLNSILPDRQHLIMNDKSFQGTLPIPIRIGDYNQDGFPDLLVLSSAYGSAESGTVSLLQNLPCEDRYPGCGRNGKRRFERVSKGAAALEKLKDARGASFLDIDEDGSLDIMVQRDGSAGGISRKFAFIKNNYYNDAFFMKTLVANGACDGLCKAQGISDARYHPYGVSYSGASVKFTIFDSTGVRRATQIAQIPQTSYLSLLTPYSFFGLGRTNNYVENLFVGSTRHQPQHFTNIEGLIPNSQVFILPYQPEGETDPGSWSRELFLHPGDWVPGVTLTVLGAILILAITVLVLHLRERRQDEMDRKQNQAFINFDAL